ncbi:SURF1 family protein [Simplicispira psychrophila]|uniref:SURF1 family protein n=1 Tax=Simplicispira psychrophila TaxID=80882 RepID=UPI0009FDD164|nr:SURF1 family protein [Simplicispira psychrophila]
MAATAALGRWQLDRAAQKEALHAAIEARSRLPVLDGASFGVPSGAAADIPALLHRRVLLRGQWLPQYTVFLDNRQMQGHVGFFVVTPLQLSQGAGVVLVQRGWAPRNFQDRTALPAIDTPTGPVQIAGRLALPPSRLYALGGDTPMQQASPIRQNLDMTAFRIETGLLPADVAVLQTDAGSEGLQRDWPAIQTGVEKHYGYAFQWFGLCTLVALLYVWFQLVPRFLPTRPRTAA